MTHAMDELFQELVAAHRQTCGACPTQYEGTLHDGRVFYFWYRHGWASLGFGATLAEAIDDPREVSLRYGDKDGGVMGEGEFRSTFVTLAHAREAV